MWGGEGGSQCPCSQPWVGLESCLIIRTGVLQPQALCLCLFWVFWQHFDVRRWWSEECA
jgi:hypothetical protein